MCLFCGIAFVFKLIDRQAFISLANPLDVFLRRRSEKNDIGCVVVVVEPESAPVPIAIFARN